MFIEMCERPQIPAKSFPCCKFTMKPRAFVMFSSITPHSHKTKP